MAKLVGAEEVAVIEGREVVDVDLPGLRREGDKQVNHFAASCAQTSPERRDIGANRANEELPYP